MQIGELESRVVVTYEKRKGGKKKKNWHDGAKTPLKKVFIKKYLQPSASGTH